MPTHRKFFKKTAIFHKAKAAPRRAARRPIAALNKNFTANAVIWGRLAMVDPFPPGRDYSLTYGQAVTLGNGAVGTFGTEQVFRLNSLADPDFTGGGHQPYGFDTLQTIYSRYKVHSVMIELTFNTPSNNEIVASMVSAPQDPVTLSSFDLNTLIERPNVDLQPISQNEPVKRIVKTFNIWDIVGMTKSQFDADISDYASTVVLNPIKVAFLRLAMAESSGTLAQDVANVSVHIKLTYHCRLWDRKTLAQS